MKKRIQKIIIWMFIFALTLTNLNIPIVSANSEEKINFTQNISDDLSGVKYYTEYNSETNKFDVTLNFSAKEKEMSDLELFIMIDSRYVYRGSYATPNYTEKYRDLANELTRKLRDRGVIGTVSFMPVDQGGALNNGRKQSQIQDFTKIDSELSWVNYYKYTDHAVLSGKKTLSDSSREKKAFIYIGYGDSIFGSSASKAVGDPKLSSIADILYAVTTNSMQENKKWIDWRSDVKSFTQIIPEDNFYPSAFNSSGIVNKDFIINDLSTKIINVLKKKAVNNGKITLTLNDGVTLSSNSIEAKNGDENLDVSYIPENKTIEVRNISIDSSGSIIVKYSIEIDASITEFKYINDVAKIAYTDSKGNSIDYNFISPKVKSKAAPESGLSDNSPEKGADDSGKTGGTNELDKIEDSSTPISVLSDIHVLSNELLPYNKKSLAFEKALASDRKLLVESEEILGRALDLVRSRGSKYIFVSGDLTKDGEKKSHEVVNDKLTSLLNDETGNLKQVFVVPGNHDIYNRHAYDYNNDTELTPINPDEFMEIYNDLVYSKASYKFNESEYYKDYLNEVNSRYSRDVKYQKYAHGYTSYATEVEGENPFIFIGLDTAIYTIDQTKEKVDGRHNTEGNITSAQLKWIRDIVKKAKSKNKAVFLVAHHGFMPHFKGQEKILSPYLLNDWNKNFEEFGGKIPSEILKDFGVNFLFTGHMHAQDISSTGLSSENELYDIETGSTVTYPLAIRHVDLVNNIESKDSKILLKVQTQLIDKFEFKDLDGLVKRVDDAYTYASKNLLTPDLASGLVDEVLPEEFTVAKALDMMGVKFGENTSELSSDQIAENLQNVLNVMLKTKEDPGFRMEITELDKKVDGMVSGITGSIIKNILSGRKLLIDVYRGNVEFNGNNESGIIIDATFDKPTSTLSFYPKVGILIKDSDVELTLKSVLSQLESNVLNDKELLSGYINIIAEKAFNHIISLGEGESMTLGEVINMAYLSHLKGDEVRSDKIQKVLDKYSGESFISDLIKTIKPELKQVLNDIFSKIELPVAPKDMINFYKISGTSILGIDAMSYIKPVINDKLSHKNLGVLFTNLESLGFSVSDQVLGLLDGEVVKSSISKLDDMIIDIIASMTSERDEEYKNAYYNDNKTKLIVTREPALDLVVNNNDENLDTINSKLLSKFKSDFVNGFEVEIKNISLVYSRSRKLVENSGIESKVEIDLLERNSFDIDRLGVYQILDSGEYKEVDNFILKDGKIVLNISEYGNYVIVKPKKLLNGWHLIQGNEKYFVNGKFMIGLQTIGKTVYLFDKNGIKQKGWKVFAGKELYFSEENGGLLTGLRTIGKTTYLLTSEGKKYGWHVINGKAMYFSPENGGRLTGLRKIGNATYLLTSEGKKYGWHVINGKVYYFNPENGVMVTGIKIIGKTKYRFNSEGHKIDMVR